MQRLRLLALGLLLWGATAAVRPLSAQAVWQRVYPSVSPVRLQFMTFDTSSQVVVGVDGDSSGSVRIWTWDGRTWSVTPSTGAPRLGLGAVGCFDESRGVLVCCIRNPNNSTTETWERPANGVWRLVVSESAARGLLHYFPAIGRVISVGWTSNIEVWELAAGGWARRSGQGPVVAGGLFAAVDRRRARLVLHGSPNDTWEWDGTSWVQMQPRNSPASRIEGGMCYDARRGRCVLYGGFFEFPTWEWDGTNWSANLTPPPTQWYVKMTFDPLRGRVVLFGDNTTGNTTWEYFAPVQAGYQRFGVACTGSAGLPSLDAAVGTLPWAGYSFSSVLQNVPATAPCVGLIGVSRQSWQAFSLPIDLSVVGAPGCSAFVSVEAVFQLANVGGSATWPLPIPWAAALLGARFYQQALVLDPSANALGATVSNAAEAVIGDR